MAFDFPASPTVGQIANGYTWDGEKWLLVSDTPNQGGVIAIKVFTASGTYTPSANMTTAVIECMGAGGGGGGCGVATSAKHNNGGSGGAGAYSRKLVTATDIGASKPITVGVGGAAGSATPGNGGTGGDTSVGVLCLAKGGGGGQGFAAGFGIGTPGVGGVGSAGIGDFTASGETGYTGLPADDVNVRYGIRPRGGNTLWGNGGNEVSPASGYGSGGAAAMGASGSAAIAGWAGQSGVVIITEYGITALSPSSSASGNVRYDVAQGLTATQQEQARKNVYAAPFDALAYNGVQLNNSFLVSQEFGVQVSLPANNYVADCWFVYNSGGGWSNPSCLMMSLGAPELPGFNYAVRMSAVAGNVVAGSDNFLLQQTVEGYRAARLGWGTPFASPVTVAFWVRTFIPGTYCCAIRNGANNNRSYVATFTTSTSSTWEYKTLLIPGDTSGTWAKDHNGAFSVGFGLVAGASNNTPTPNAWAAGAFTTFAGATNAVGSAGGYYDIAGVTVLPGVQAPTSTQLAQLMRPFDQELVACQRYYQKSYQYATRPGTAVGDGGGSQQWGVSTFTPVHVTYPTRLRAGPSVILYDNNGAQGKISTLTGAVWSGGQNAAVSSALDTGFNIQNTGSGIQISFDYTAIARL